MGEGHQIGCDDRTTEDAGSIFPGMDTIETEKNEKCISLMDYVEGKTYSYVVSDLINLW